MSARNDGTPREWYPGIVCMGLIGVVAAAVILVLTHLAEQLGPQIGDIISFDREGSSLGTQMLITGIPAGASRDGPCILDARVMLRFGGSLVIEARQVQPDPSYRVHWAGVRTSDGKTDCGPSADLLLNQYQVAALIFAAGGKGIKSHAFVTDSSPGIDHHT